MVVNEVALPGLPEPALLRLPAGGSVRAGVVTLHPAYSPAPDQPLFEHLAATVTPLGFAVLSYARRLSPDGGDVPLRLQAEDALVAHAWLQDRHPVPVGL